MNAMMARILKALHEIGAIGLMGSMAACVVLVATASRDSLVEYAAIRGGILAITKWLVVPSLVLVLVTGLLAIAANNVYKDAGWAWVKAFLGISMFEGTLLTIQASSRKLAEMTAAAVQSGVSDAAALEPLLRTEWYGLWTMITLSTVNILLAVWRPRLRRRSVQDA
jgi:hypothetical protein